MGIDITNRFFSSSSSLFFVSSFYVTVVATVVALNELGFESSLTKFKFYLLDLLGLAFVRYDALIQHVESDNRSFIGKSFGRRQLRQLSLRFIKICLLYTSPSPRDRG